MPFNLQANLQIEREISRRISIALKERRTLEIIAESFNTLNGRNLQFPNNTVGSAATPAASFRQPRPRRIRDSFSSACVSACRSEARATASTPFGSLSVTVEIRPTAD
jgi:hypothetical protein